MKYGLNDRLPFLDMVLYGLQWFVVTLPSVVITGVILANIHFSGFSSQLFYIQKIIALVGLTLLAQILWGHRLPLVVGPASVLLIGVIAASTNSYSSIYSSILIAGAFLMTLSLSGYLKYLFVLFTPRIIVTILILIAITLSPVIIGLIFEKANGNGLFNLVFALMLNIAMICAYKWLRGVWKSVVVVLGLIVGSGIYYFMMGFDSSFPINSSLSFNIKDNSLFLYPFEFNFTLVLSFVFCYIALLINELGSIQSVGQILNADNMDSRTARGVTTSCITNMVSSFFGVIGCVDFSFSVGVINSTRCASRFALIPAGIALVVIAFFPSVIDILCSIPSVVMGSILFYLMSLQLSAGLQLVEKEKSIVDYNSGVTVALPLMLAIIISFLPKDVIAEMPAIIRPIIGNGFVVGITVAMVCEHIIFAKRSKD